MFKRTITLIIAAAILCLAGLAGSCKNPPPAPAETAQEDAAPAVRAEIEDPLADLDDYVLYAMEEWGVPGAAVAIVRDGNILVLNGS